MPSLWRSTGVLVERIVADLNPNLTRDVRLMALLHDAPEYVIGDLISPFRSQSALITRHWRTNFRRQFISARPAGAPAARPPGPLKKADLIAAYYEATQLAGFEEKEARRFFNLPPAGLRPRAWCRSIRPPPRPSSWSVSDGLSS